MKNNEILNMVKEDKDNLMVESIYNTIMSKKEDFEYGYVFNEKYKFPVNIKGNMYNGTNIITLKMNSFKNDYETLLYMTFLQCKNENMMIKKNEHGVKVYYYEQKIIENNKENDNKEDNEQNKQEKNTKKILIAKAYTVFNLDQIENCERKEKIKETYYNIKYKYNDEENIIKNIEKALKEDNYIIKEKLYNSNPFVLAKPEDKTIYMPSRKYYKSAYLYIYDILHEISHKKAMEYIKNINEYSYAMNEIIAETSAIVTLEKLNIKNDSKIQIDEYKKNASAYMYNWCKKIDNEEDIKKSIKEGILVSENVMKDIKLENILKYNKEKGIEI